MKISIESQSDLLPKIKEHLKKDETRQLLGNALDKIAVIGCKPAFLLDSWIRYLTDNNIPFPSPNHLRLYIGQDITQTVEKYGGAELPADVLDTYVRFKEEVLSRVLAVLDVTPKKRKK